MELFKDVPTVAAYFMAIYLFLQKKRQQICIIYPFVKLRAASCDNLRKYTTELQYIKYNYWDLGILYYASSYKILSGKPH